MLSAKLYAGGYGASYDQFSSPIDPKQRNTNISFSFFQFSYEICVKLYIIDYTYLQKKMTDANTVIAINLQAINHKREAEAEAQKNRP